MLKISVRCIANSLWEWWGRNGIFGQTACLTRIFFRIHKSGMTTQITQSTQSFCGRRAWLLWVLLALAALVRLVAIDRPLLGNFATKNVVYAMIARNWVHGRTSLWYPTLDCLVGDDRGLHMLELPLSAYLAGGLWNRLGGSLDAWGRSVSVLFSVAAVGLLWRIVWRRHGQTAAAAACLALVVAPISVQYGQSFMLEASLVFFLVAAWWAIDDWRESPGLLRLIVYALSLALLLLTKVYALVFVFPLLLAAWRRSENPTAEPPSLRNSEFRIPNWWGRKRGQVQSVRSTLWAVPANCTCPLFLLLAATLLAILPAAAWYAHAYATARPESPLSSRVYYSVRNSAEMHAPPSPLLRSPVFYVRMVDDLCGPVLTPLGCGLLLVTLLAGRWRAYWAWLAAAALLMAALPLKFYEMNYYWMALLPPLCVLLGLGWDAICSRFAPSRAAMTCLVLLAMAWSLRYCGRPAFVTPSEDRPVVAAGQAIQRLAGATDRVVTMHGTGIDLLYYCDRPGWALDPAAADLPARLADYRSSGARWLVLVGDVPACLTKIECLVPAIDPSPQGYAVFRIQP